MTCLNEINENVLDEVQQCFVIHKQQNKCLI